MDEIEIGFDEIKEGDEIRTVRSDDRVTVTIQGDAEWQDEDGDWRCGDELLTYQDGEYEEKYFLLSSGSLPTTAGSLVTWDNYLGAPVFSMKAYGDDGWFTTFPDGSSCHMNDLQVARKKWAEVG